jgi:predicted RNase H-like HicB family nuclease
MASVLAFVHEENGSYGISFPDFPGCVSGGRSLDEVMRKGADALAFHIDGMVEEGIALPEPRSFAAIRGDRTLAAAMKGALLTAVTIDLPTKIERVNITIEKRLLEQIDRAAAAEGGNRSQWLANAARARLRPRQRSTKGRSPRPTRVRVRKRKATGR